MDPPIDDITDIKTLGQLRDARKGMITKYLSYEVLKAYVFENIIVIELEHLRASLHDPIPVYDGL